MLQLCGIRVLEHTQRWSTCCDIPGLGVAKGMTRVGVWNNQKQCSSIFLLYLNQWFLQGEAHFCEDTFSHHMLRLLLTCFNCFVLQSCHTNKWRLKITFSCQRNTASYLRRATHHQLYEVPATPLGCVDISHRVQAFQGAVFREAADQHGPLGPFGHPARPSHLLAVGPRRVSLVQIGHPNQRGRLSPPPLPQLHLPSSTRGRSHCVGFINLGGGCRLLVGIWPFVIVQASNQWAGSSCGNIGHVFCHCRPALDTV